MNHPLYVHVPYVYHNCCNCRPITSEDVPAVLVILGSMVLITVVFCKLIEWYFDRPIK